ncbi:MAG: AMP-binding protein [Emcibacter sp.]|nr:AMP-binding protein [Emcibacter sp.]
MSIANWIEKWAAHCPEKIAIQFEDEKICYRDFDQKIKDTTVLLQQALGIKKGDRVAYLGQNHPRMFYLFFACARLGAVFVPLNWRLAPSEHLHMLRNCAASALFVSVDYQDQCAPLLEKIPHCQFITDGQQDSPGWQKLSQISKASAQGNTLNPAPPLTLPEIDVNTPVLIIFTSGTTGFPKGALLTQAALESNVSNSIHMHDMVFDDIILTILPMFHVGGLNIQSTPAFSVGATVILHRAFDVDRTIAALNHDRPTLTIILPAHMIPLQNNEKWATVDLSSLRSVTTGSCAIPTDVTAFWHDRNIPLLQVYGSSETCPIAIHQRAENAFDTAGSIGFPAKNCTIRIMDHEGQDCPDDQPGEILIQGPNIMVGYWQDKPATDKALKEGWYHTGDIGYRDKHGCYHFVDRKKDLIISGGENIYPAELETVLGSHADIQEIAVVGRPDDRWGEVVVAFIVLHAGSSLNSHDILEWLGDRLGRYKHPRHFHFIDQMPRNGMGKIIKEDLKNMA